MIGPADRLSAADFRRWTQTGSRPERILALQLAHAGIEFVREVRFAPPRRWRLDFLVEGRLAVEVEGGGFIAGRHSRGKGIENDCEKSAAIAARGWPLIRVTPRQVEQGLALRWIRQALGLSQDQGRAPGGPDHAP